MFGCCDESIVYTMRNNCRSACSFSNHTRHFITRIPGQKDEAVCQPKGTRLTPTQQQQLQRSQAPAIPQHLLPLKGQHILAHRHHWPEVGGIRSTWNKKHMTTCFPGQVRKPKTLPKG